MEYEPQLLFCDNCGKPRRQTDESVPFPGLCQICANGAAKTKALILEILDGTAAKEKPAPKRGGLLGLLEKEP